MTRYEFYMLLIELAESAILRTLNGIPNGALQLKAYGNAVSPPQFYPIFKAIAELENA